MKFGVNMVPVHPTQLGEVAVLAENLGFESLWLGEHIAVPYEASGGYPGGKPPFKPDSHFVEPFATMAYLGGITKKVRLGTGVAIFPARPPIHLARLIATADVLSGGRVSLGIGTGWLKDEFDISLSTFEDRGPRLDEQLEILDRLFNDERPEFHGKYYDMPAIGFEPKPIQRPHPPFLIGGTADVALRRAARVGDGWYGGGGPPDAAKKTLERLSQLRAEYGRTGDFEITMILGWGQGFDADRVAGYEAIGVHRLVVTPWPRSSQAVEGMTAFARDAGLSS